MNIVEPSHRQIFQIQWESTLKCNLDCTYCGDGHNNKIPHPSLEESCRTVDFILEYTNLMMKMHSKDLRLANLNVYGGESMFHPHIIEILEYAREKRKEYKDFTFNVSTITNAVVGKNAWTKISQLLDYFTISYHAESLPKQQEMVRNNILHLQKIGKNFHVSIMMHPKHWNNCIEMVKWCEENNIRHNKRQIDHSWTEWRFNYTKEQAEYLYGKNTASSLSFVEKIGTVLRDGVDLSSKGRECCGRVPFYIDQDYENTQSFIENKFKGWSCSVHRYFLYIRQSTGEIFTNKDCRMNFDSKVGALGNLKNSNELLDTLREYVDSDSFPIITCKKKTCWCGMCAPKAKTQDDYERIMAKYIT